MSFLKAVLLLFALFYVLPIAASAILYGLRGDGADWRTADRSSAGLLPLAASHPEALVRVFAAPTVRWRGIFAVHCWIVVKPAGAEAYIRYDYTAWGEPIRVNGFEPDGRWFGQTPEIVFAADGSAAAALIPRIRKAVADYAWRKEGDYHAWPGPNSNTFVAAVMSAVPETQISLPSNAIGKDYPFDGRWLRRTPSGTGLQFTAGGYGGVSIGWVDGLEINILGAVAGLDVRRPAIKLPGLGRFGVSEPPQTIAAVPQPVADAAPPGDATEAPPVH